MGCASVDGPPASDWFESRPAGLAAQFWARERPTVATLGRFDLPDGNVVHGREGQLLGWVSAPNVERDLGGLWLECARQFPATGLWPVCDNGGLHPDRGWDRSAASYDSPYSDPYAVPSDAFSAVNLADRRHYYDFPDDPGYFRRIMQESGIPEVDGILAAPSVLPDEPLNGLVVPEGLERLTLVACRRPADAPLILDFGVANDDATPGLFTGVLRSWETRFGLVPVRLTSDWTLFQVLAPPTDPLEIERLSAEVFSFANDSALQGGFHVHDRKRSVPVQEMVRSREWLIWWD